MCKLIMKIEFSNPHRHAPTLYSHHMLPCRHARFHARTHTHTLLFEWYMIERHAHARSRATRTRARTPQEAAVAVASAADTHTYTHTHLIICMIHHGTLEEVERAYSSYDDDDQHEPRKQGGRKARQLVLPLQRGVGLVKSYC